jgi:hypothetical protein
MFMSKTFIMYICISYIAMFGAIYLMVKCIDLIEDYLYYRSQIKTLSRIEQKVDQLPGVNKEKSNEYL